MKGKFYITSAIPYVNAAPHIGHAQEFVYADVVRRYESIKRGNAQVRYLCGADENALKIVQAADKANTDPQRFCDVHNAEFLNLAKQLNVHFDFWQRGTDRVHHFPASQKLWELCAKNGDIYKKSYEGLYCVGCESFYMPDELDENGECFEHPGRKLDKVSEENYFFRLSKYQKFISDLLIKGTLDIIPEIRKNEAIAFVERGLEDFSISRSVARAKSWGVPVPDDPSQIMYVWFDALNIYQSGIGLAWDEEHYRAWAPQDIMIIGKGIIRFHAAYWPAILRSAGLPIPKKLFAHGYLTVDGRKMSKTLGNVVDPLAVIKTYGTDAVRYYLLREIPSHADGDYSDRRFKEVYNADLANGLGNVVARVAKLCETSRIFVDNIETESTYYEVTGAIEKLQFDQALADLWKHLKILDAKINADEPWKLSPEKASDVLPGYIRVLRIVAQHLAPFLPQTAAAILDQFTGPTIKSQPPLFPRIP